MAEELTETIVGFPNIPEPERDAFGENEALYLEWRRLVQALQEWQKEEALGIEGAFSERYQKNRLSPGHIFAYGSDIAPDGFLLCDGTSYARTDQQALFDIIGTVFGTADGASFNVPDLRGRFIRGQDDGQAVDPEAANRTEMKPGGATGDAVGSIQADAFDQHNHSDGNHRHNYTYRANTQNRGQGSNPLWQGTSTQLTGNVAITTNNAGGAETRPRNAGVYFIIKA